MAFRYLTGQTTAGAPDAIADFFATFQDWITNQVGWVLEGGGGTTNLVLRSLGEAGNYSLLWVNIWESAANTVRAEVQDDLAGTHKTNEAGTLGSAGAQFTYHVAADLEAITIAWETGGGAWTWIYVGTVWPFAMAAPDETYYMMATSAIDAGSVLRRHEGTWDVDVVLYTELRIRDQGINPLNNSFTIGGLIADRFQTMIGQFRHVSGLIGDPAIATDDTLSTVASDNGITTWFVVGEGANMLAMRTGGALPTGNSPGAAFGHTSGFTLDEFNNIWQDFITVKLAAFMASRGWADLGSQGWHTVDRLFYSRGSSGVDDIFVAVGWDAGTQNLYARVQDDAGATHHTGDADFVPAPTNVRQVPYYISGDRDSVVFTLRTHNSGAYPMCWVGKADQAIGDDAGTEYFMATVTGSNAARWRLLRAAGGGWVAVPTLMDFFNAAQFLGTDSSPNLTDGRTDLLLPMGLSHSVAGRQCLVGRLKYVKRWDGGMLRGDTLEVAEHSYRLFGDGTGFQWAMRTA